MTVTTTVIIISCIAVGIVGLICGLGLGVASEKFKVEVDEKEVAVREALPGNLVRCSGTCDKAKTRYNNVGPKDCIQMTVIPGAGDKACEFGCLGGGSCVAVCDFDAIHVVDGIAVVDKEKCVSCGKCVKACPKHLIEIVPYKSKYHVRCMSQDKGKAVMDACTAGCIGCTLCTKECHFDAIHMNGNVAQIDYTKCKNCSLCAKKCPKGVIN